MAELKKICATLLQEKADLELKLKPETEQNEVGTQCELHVFIFLQGTFFAAASMQDPKLFKKLVPILNSVQILKEEKGALLSRVERYYLSPFGAAGLIFFFSPCRMNAELMRETQRATHLVASLPPPGT